MHRLPALGIALGFVVGLWGSALAAPIADVTQPTDAIVAVHGQDDGDGQVSTPGGDNPPPGEPEWNAIDNSFNTKYLNFLDLNSGFTVMLDSYGPAFLTGIALATANDAPERDPASVTITGSNDGGANWLPIVTGLATPLPDVRKAEAQFAFVPETAGTFSIYTVIFPTLKDAGAANSMQIAEVRLMSDDAGPPPLDVTRPGDTIVGTSLNYPVNEPPPNAIDDNENTKYLNFDKEGSGFIVTLDTLGPAAIDGIALRTADDSPPRDPASVTIRGSNDSGSTWDPIITDLLTPLPDDRFTDTEFGFSPLTPGTYSMYEVMFPTLKDSGAANSMQIGEVRLLPEPATLALLGLGVIGLAARRRRG